MRCNPHYHNIDLPNGRSIRTRTDCNPPKVSRRSNKPEVLGDDEELGNIFSSLIKLAAPIAGGIIGGPAGALIGGAGGKMLGGLVEGKKKKGQPAQQTATPAEVAAAMPVAPTAIAPEHVMQAALASVPTRADIKDQVLNAIRETNNQKNNAEKTAQQIASTVNPTLKKIIDILAQAKLQKQATAEHKAIIKSDARWNNLAKSNKQILAKIAELEKRIAASKARNALVASTFGVPDKHL